MTLFVRWLLATLLLMGMQSAFAAGCGVASAALAFGSYAAGTPTHADAQGSISLTCTGLLGEVVVYTVSLATGVGGSGFSPRALKSGTNAAQYNVYTDSARTRVWGDGSSQTFTVSDSLEILARITPRNLPVYGRVFGGQSPPPGVYVDSLILTLSF